MGFTADGILKLFDFGLARELDPSLNRKLTGCTGSRRYMAPEVAQALPYGLPADVYSYGVFLYECCELQKPYANMTRSEHFDLVVCGRYRPKFYGTCTPSLQRLICKCWAKAPRVRPNIARVVQALEGELDQENSAPSKEKQGETPSHYIYSFFRWSPMRHNCLHPHEASKESACAA
jgi:serine/threonine protein kinase